MFTKSYAANGWLAFELNILRRLKFGSAVLPFVGEPHLGLYLKRLNVRVLANDASQSAWTKAVAVIQNNAEKLSGEDVDTILEDAYVPRYRLQNQALKNWFGETDAWWFDNVRQNIEKLASPLARAIASSVAMGAGDCVLSFDEETRELRQPLSDVFKRLCSIQPEPVNNGQNNACHNKTAVDFIAENFADLMFLRLPPARSQSLRNHLGAAAWREEWRHCGDSFWNESEAAQAGKLGASVETKHQYLHFLAETLQTASHVPLWVISHAEDGVVSAQDVIEIVGQIRRVDTIFTKDFSELTGTKAAIITA